MDQHGPNFHPKLVESQSWPRFPATSNTTRAKQMGSNPTNTYPTVNLSPPHKAMSQNPMGFYAVEQKDIIILHQMSLHPPS